MEAESKLNPCLLLFVSMDTSLYYMLFSKVLYTHCPYEFSTHVCLGKPPGKIFVLVETLCEKER